MSRFLKILEECCSGKSDKDCSCKKKGKKCDGKCGCDKKITEATNPKCPSCGKELYQGSNMKNYMCKNEDCKKFEHMFKPEDLKESDLSEAKAKVCPQCGIKYSKLSKDEGFCTECATPIKESKDDDERSDWKYHSKKDDDLDKDRCPECGSNKGYVKGKCIGCGTTLQPKGIKESKFQKYLKEQEFLNEILK